MQRQPGDGPLAGVQHEFEERLFVLRQIRVLLGQRHFDVQIIGGYAMHRGFIAEMRTGEGKTLVATLPTYLNALAGNGAHVGRQQFVGQGRLPHPDCRNSA